MDGAILTPSLMWRYNLYVVLDINSRAAPINSAGHYTKRKWRTDRIFSRTERKRGQQVSNKYVAVNVHEQILLNVCSVLYRRCSQYNLYMCVAYCGVTSLATLSYPGTP